MQKVGQIRVAARRLRALPLGRLADDVAAAKRLVRKAARLADVVVVTMHAGAEGTERQHVRAGTELFLGENRGNPVRFAHAVVDAGADLVVGHGPHVLRGMEWYRGRLIAYSLGNFAGYKVFSLGGPLSTSGILRVTAPRRRQVRDRAGSSRRTSSAPACRRSTRRGGARASCATSRATTSAPGP